MIDKFFEKYPYINKTEFLKMLPEDKGLSLEAMIPNYLIRMKELQVKDPDSDESIDRLKSSLKFIFKFCVEKQIDFSDYVGYTEGVLPQWVEHLKRHDISFYSLHALEFPKMTVDSEIIEFTIPKFFHTFQKTRNLFFASKKMKTFSKKAVEILKVELNKNVLETNKQTKTNKLTKI